MTITHKQGDTMSECCEAFADMTIPGSRVDHGAWLLSLL